MAAGVLFAPEAHAAYAELGFGGSPVAQDGVARPNIAALLPQSRCVYGSGTRGGRSCRVRLLRPEGCGARRRGRMEDHQPGDHHRGSRAGRHRDAAADPWRSARGPRSGHRAAPRSRRRRSVGSPPHLRGLRSLGFPATPLGDLWRTADLVREHRGDSHVIAWAVGGVDAVEILLLTEPFWGLPARSYAPTRGWTSADMDAGFDRLKRRGLMTADEQPTDAGRAFREEIEVRTDELERPVLDALGDDWTSSSGTSTPGPRRSSTPAPTRSGSQGSASRRRAALRLRVDHRHRGRAVRKTGMTCSPHPGRHSD